MTFNMANYDDHPNWSVRVGLFVQILTDKQPDVVLFQECRFNPDQPQTKSSYQNMAEQVLATLQSHGQFLGAYHHHVPIERIPLASDSNGFDVPSPASQSPLGKTIEWEALSIISKFWIKETGCLWLTSPQKVSGDLNTRATQYAALDLSNGSSTPNLFYVFNAHFAYVVDDAVQNVQTTIEYIRRFIPTSNGNYLLAGDFNMEPGSQPVNLLDNSGDLVDLWKYIWGSEGNGYTYPSTGPVKRIDYIYTSPLMVKKTKNIFLCGTSPDTTSGTFASDHYGLIVTFALPTKSHYIVDEEDDIVNGFYLV